MAKKNSMFVVKHSIQRTSCRRSSNKVPDLGTVKELHSPQTIKCFPMWQLECRFNLRRIFTLVPEKECFFAVHTKSFTWLFAMMCVGLEKICCKVCLMVSGWLLESRCVSQELFKRYTQLAFIDQLVKNGKDHGFSGFRLNSSQSAFCVFVLLCYRWMSRLQIVQRLNTSFMQMVT